MKSPHLYYFKSSEFLRVVDKDATRNWYDSMSARLLVCLDICRYRWSEYHHEDSPIHISGHNDAIGREMPGWALSDHNVTVHGEVRGIDVMPAGMDTREDAQAFIEIARESGITAIGLYPRWRPRAGVHLGDRRTAKPGSPATWGGIPGPDGKQVYVSLNDALELMP